MQIIWYENKALVFKSGDAEADIPCVRGGTGSDLSPANLLQKFDNNNILYVLSENPRHAFETFLSHTTVVEAAGGVVEDGTGRILMMRRRGWWDLPKGHVEKGESHEEAALREVAEETGLRQMRLLGPLTTTRHFYRMHGRWETKCTWWYGMRCEGDETPVPQTEEDITETRWMQGTELWQAVAGSYGTIREVFDAWTKRSDPHRRTADGTWETTTKRTTNTKGK